MTDTKLSSLPSWLLTELLSVGTLAPLRNRFALLGFLNSSSIDGLAGQTRKIRKRHNIAEAVADSEDTGFTAYEEFVEGSPTLLTPTPYVQGVKPDVPSLGLTMPGAKREEVIAAIMALVNMTQESARALATALPMLRMIVEEIIDAHYRAAERAALALFPGLSQSAGTTNTELSVATLIDGQTTLFDVNKPAHRAIAAFVSAKGIGQLRKELGQITGPTILGSGWGAEFLNALGGPAPTALQPFGNLLGMPILETDGSLMTTANASVDLVGAIACVGRGAADAPGSLRGFAEFCEGHSLDIGVGYSLTEDTAPSIGRYSWDVKEHTDEHGVGLIYKK